MDNNLHDIEQVERYLDRSLSASERKELEKRMTEDPEFKNLFVEYRQLVNGIRYAHLKNKLQQLKVLENTLGPVEMTAREGKQIRMLVNWKITALAAAVVLTVAGYLIFRDTTPINEQLFVAYYETFDSPGPGLTRGQNDGVLTWKQKGYQAYDKGKFEEAIAAFDKALQENRDPIVELCKGNAFLALNQPEKAEAVFQSILKDHDDLVTQAKWYLALSYLKQNKIERVKSTLWEISKSSTYGEKSRKLLNELD